MFMSHGYEQGLLSNEFEPFFLKSALELEADMLISEKDEQLFWKSVLNLDSALYSVIKDLDLGAVIEAFNDDSAEILNFLPGFIIRTQRQSEDIGRVYRGYREVERLIGQFEDVYAITAIYDQLKPKYDGLMWVLGLE